MRNSRPLAVAALVLCALMGLMAAGYHTSDGKVVPPLASPGGKRTTEELYK